MIVNQEVSQDNYCCHLIPDLTAKDDDKLKNTQENSRLNDHVFIISIPSNHLPTATIPPIISTTTKIDDDESSMDSLNNSQSTLDIQSNEKPELYIPYLPLFNETHGSPESGINPILTGDGTDESNPTTPSSTITPFSSSDEWKLSPSNSLLSLAKIIIPEFHESWLDMLKQISGPMFVAGLGMILAGYLLNDFSEWTVFLEISDMLAVVTPLLGLKGNLGMTLASRLATHANLGQMNTCKLKIKICLANLFVDQFLGIIAGLFASFLAISMGAGLAGEKFNFDRALILTSTCCATASLVSVLLGLLMCTIIIVSKNMNWNPDNLAIPLAGVVGDVVTLTLLAFIGSFIYGTYKNFSWIPYVTLSINLFCIPICGFVAFKHECTKRVFKTGWISVMISVLISSGGGLILEQFEAKHVRMTLYQPLINGFGGNIVSVLASRVATQFHRDCKKGVLPNNSSILISPLQVFFGKGEHAVAARVLILLVIPYQAIFSGIVDSMEEFTQFNSTFSALFVLASLIQVIILIYIGRILLNICWKLKSDPDCNSIPYLTALGDLLGSALLLGVFEAMIYF